MDHPFESKLPVGVPKPAPRRWLRWLLIALVLVGMAVISHIAYWGGAVDPREYLAADLVDGPITQIIRWSDGGTAVQVSQLSDLPADHLWKVVTDQGRFDEFMPYVRSTSVESGPGGVLIEKQILDLPQASYELVLEIRLSEVGDSRTAAWRQTQGALDYNEGAWVVEAAGPKTILRYQVAAGLGWCPRWLTNYAMRRRLARLLESVEARVRALQTGEPEYFATSAPSKR